MVSAGLPVFASCGDVSRPDGLEHGHGASGSTPDWAFVSAGAVPTRRRDTLWRRDVSCELWARDDLGRPPTPGGTAEPVFLHVPRTRVQKAGVSQSRSNADMLDVLTIVLKRLIAQVGIEKGDVAVVTPYKAQLKKLGQRFRGYVAFRDTADLMQLTTADRVHGAERKIFLFVMVSTAESGAGFLMDRNRLNVISTRATDYFVVIGDSDVAKKLPGRNQSESDIGPFLGWIQWFVDRRRVVDTNTLAWAAKGSGASFP